MLTVIFDIPRTPWIGREGQFCRCHGWRAGIVVAAAALVDLGRVDEAKEFIGQLLKILPQSRIDPAFVRRQNRNSSTMELTIAALRLAGLPD